MIFPYKKRKRETDFALENKWYNIKAKVPLAK
jgi:hypothetical protein